MTDNNNNVFFQNIIAEKAKPATVLAVTSGKGGVGKTNISANLAICLALANKKVTLLDADLGLGNLDVIMNVNCRYNLWHVVRGMKSLEDIIQPGPAGIDIICGGSGIEDLANISTFQRQRLLDELNRIQNNSDYLIIDNGAGINATVIGFCLAADHTVVVTTPEPTAMTDAYAVIKVLAGRGYDGKISLIVNMANSVDEGKKIYRHLSDVAGRFLNIPLYEAGIICKNDSLQSAVRKRRPVVLEFPKASISSEFASIAARLTSAMAQNSQKDGFFKKVVNWFF